MAKIVRFEQLKKVRFNQLGERQVMTGQQTMLVKNTVQPGFPHFLHRHPHEQILTIQSGTADVTVGTETFRMGPGDMIYIPANTDHDFQVVGDEPVVNYDIFAPVREDFLMALSADSPET